MLYIASDHAGYELKNKIIKIIKDIKMIDLGCNTEDSVDYPDYAHKLCSEISENDRGILICGTGIGMSMAANKHKSIRAALCHNIKSTKLSREHNDANVMTIGARLTKKSIALKCVSTFLSTSFDGGYRHIRRIKKI